MAAASAEAAAVVSGHRKEWSIWVAVYPGSFDPITNGHLDIIRRASKVFDNLVVAVLNNNSKQPLFSVEERTNLLRNVTADLPNVIVDNFQDLLINYMKQKNIRIIVRGLRAVTDFEYELHFAITNQKLYENIETIFMTAVPEFSYLSSSLVKQIAKYQGNVSAMVPEIVELELQKKFDHIYSPL